MCLYRTCQIPRLIDESLRDLGFNDIEHEHLITERFVFILDGLDELRLEQVPKEGLLCANEILEFPNAKIIVTSRNHYIVALEQKFGVTAHHHLTQQQRASVEDVFMMPFGTKPLYAVTPNKHSTQASDHPED